MLYKVRCFEGGIIMSKRSTPSSVLYADLRSFGKITNKAAARILLSARIGAGGKAPRDRIESRTYLSREVVHVLPQNVIPSIYADFYSSTQTLFSQIKKHLHGTVTTRMLVVHFAEEAALKMSDALRVHGLDAQIYLNECNRLTHVRLCVEKDRPLLLFMLFCIVGCLADVKQAVRQVEEFAHHKLSQDLATISVDLDSQEQTTESTGAQIGLLRIQNGVAQSSIKTLRPAGSVVGTLATGPGAISNVGPDVSRTHARIWREGNRWLCIGLKSTNGTFIISGVDKSMLCVEPPHSRRNAKIDYPPQEIQEGDILQFGRDTKFLVLRVKPEKQIES